MRILEGKKQEINNRFNEMSKVRCKEVHQITLDLAKEYGVSWTTIRNEIDKENLKNAKNRLTDGQQIVYNRLKEGLTQSQIAKELGVTRQNVGMSWNKIKKKGYTIEIEKFKRN